MVAKLISSARARSQEGMLMFFEHHAYRRGFARIACVFGMAALGAFAAAGEPSLVLRHVVVYREPGRFAGWPANHGIWSWGDEILVGFSRGTYKDRGPFHHIDHDKPEEFLLARSRDGGDTWSVESPGRRGPWRARPACATAPCRRASPEEQPVDLRRRRSTSPTPTSR